MFGNAVDESTSADKLISPLRSLGFPRLLGFAGEANRAAAD
jgi:hypothetical protein